MPFFLRIDLRRYPPLLFHSFLRATRCRLEKRPSWPPPFHPNRSWTLHPILFFLPPTLKSPSFPKTARTVLLYSWPSNPIRPPHVGFTFVHAVYVSPPLLLYPNFKPRFRFYWDAVEPSRPRRGVGATCCTVVFQCDFFTSTPLPSSSDFMVVLASIFFHIRDFLSCQQMLSLPPVILVLCFAIDRFVIRRPLSKVFAL